MLSLWQQPPRVNFVIVNETRTWVLCSKLQVKEIQALPYPLQKLQKVKVENKNTYSNFLSSKKNNGATNLKMPTIN